MQPVTVTVTKQLNIIDVAGETTTWKRKIATNVKKKVTWHLSRVGNNWKYNRIDKLGVNRSGNRRKWRVEPWPGRLSGSFWRRRWRDLRPRTCRENCHEPLHKNGEGRRWERGLTESCGEERRRALSGIWSMVKCSYSPPWICCNCETNLELTLYPLLVFSITLLSYVLLMMDHDTQNTTLHSSLPPAHWALQLRPRS